MFINLIKVILEENSGDLLRPPGAKPEEEFLKQCIHCGKCAQACPYDSITFLENPLCPAEGTPIIDARNIPCYVCMKCPEVCPTGALDRELKEKENIKMGIAKIDESKCLPYLGIICRACFQNCPIYREAIILEDDLRPKVITEKCIGCGICQHVCPVEDSAIIIESSNSIVNSL
jgi:ferredoxin-type protein NapG